MKKFILLFILYFFVVGTLFSKALFEPIDDNKIIFIVGQDLGAIGGFGDFDFSAYGTTENGSSHNNGYTDHVGLAGGITTYLNPSSGNEGLFEITNYGSGDVCAACITSNEIYNNTILSVGLYLKGRLDDINNNLYDSYFKDILIPYFKSINRPVFLRIGYEFNGEWNEYNPTKFINAWRHIVNLMRAENVTNVAFVWQSSGYSESVSHLMQWYPGDEYVDWLGFSQFWTSGNGICSIAREKGKPVMIAEAAPMSDVKTQRNPEIWDTWYTTKFFDYIYANQDVIKAVAYINVDWNSQPMWEYNPPTQATYWGDSRIQAYEPIKEKWLLEMQKECWLHSSETLFEQLNMQKTNTEKTIKSEQEPHVFYDPTLEKLVFNTYDNGFIYLYETNGKLIFQKEITASETAYTISTQNIRSNIVIAKIVTNNNNSYLQKITLY